VGLNPIPFRPSPSSSGSRSLGVISVGCHVWGLGFEEVLFGVEDEGEREMATVSGEKGCVRVAVRGGVLGRFLGGRGFVSGGGGRGLDSGFDFEVDFELEFGFGEEDRLGFRFDGEEPDVNAMVGSTSLCNTTARAFSAIIGSTFRVPGMMILKLFEGRISGVSGISGSGCASIFTRFRTESSSSSSMVVLLGLWAEEKSSFETSSSCRPWKW